MKRITLIMTLLVCLVGNSWGAEGRIGAFGNAKWIAMDSDKTILFPHIHLLKAKSPEGQSLTKYALPILTKDFALRKKVIHAEANICGLGQYALYINGKRAGDSFLDPGWTMYNKRLYYNTLDVTDMLKSQKKGSTVNIAVMLGGGMYDIPVKGYHKFAGSCGAPKLLFSLDIQYTDGTHQTIVSDDSWHAAESKIRYCSIYSGETYDATFEGTPQPVVLTKPHWDVPLEKQDNRTRLCIHQELPAAPIVSGSNIYDTRQNCSGIVSIKVKGERGKKITLRPAEILKDGKINQKCLPGYAWTYTLRGDKAGETWQPLFSYTGFRYVEVTADEGVELQSLSALHTSTNTSETGHFECSDTLFNRIYTLIDWAISSNLASITTDCPTREKLGWQEQNHLMAYSMMYRYDMHALMNKIANDLADSQHEDGAIPTIAPEYTVFSKGSGFEDTPEWGASFILCPYYTYLWYGDDSAIRKHYDAMKRYMAYLDSRADSSIINYGLGDWFDVGPNRPGVAQLTPVALSATAMYYYELTVMNRFAALLGKKDDAEVFSTRATEVKEAFNKRFWNGDMKCYGQGSQTASAMAIFMNLTTEDTHKATIERLVGDIHNRLQGNEAIVTAGDVGYRYVVQSLLQCGQSELIWQMNRRDDIPGYAYQLRQGATALTESWQAYDNVSNDHLMLGHLMEWLFESPGGIRQAEGSVGWQHIIIDPQMVGTLTWAKTSLDTPNGVVKCHWTCSADRKSWSVSVTIPQGATAEIHLPDGRTVNESVGDYQYKTNK